MYYFAFALCFLIYIEYSKFDYTLTFLIALLLCTAFISFNPLIGAFVNPRLKTAILKIREGHIGYTIFKSMAIVENMLLIGAFKYNDQEAEKSLEGETPPEITFDYITAIRDNDGKIFYEGEQKPGTNKRHGRGIEYVKDLYIYEGYFKDD